MEEPTQGNKIQGKMTPASRNNLIIKRKTIMVGDQTVSKLRPTLFFLSNLC